MYKDCIRQWEEWKDCVSKNPSAFKEGMLTGKVYLEQFNKTNTAVEILIEPGYSPEELLRWVKRTKMIVNDVELSVKYIVERGKSETIVL